MSRYAKFQKHECMLACTHSSRAIKGSGIYSHYFTGLNAKKLNTQYIFSLISDIDYRSDDSQLCLIIGHKLFA